MKRPLLLLLLVGGLVTGCGEKTRPAAPATGSKGDSLVTAPVDYLNTATKAQQQAVKTIDTTALTQAIQLFYTEKGRYPKDLNELVTEQFVRKIPETPHGTKLDYDATTGTVKVVNQ